MSGGIHYDQDLPPKSGYEPIRYKRNLPARGPGGLVIFTGVFSICAYGFYRVILGNWEQRELKREMAWSRINLVPLLLAESDRDTHRRELATLRKEEEIMKDVPGWKPGQSVYNTKRYTPASFVIL